MITNVEFNLEKSEDERITTFCVYDPFEGEGLIICKNMTKIDFNRKMQQIVKIAEGRTKNLKGFRLNVS
jgi:hypothetical protein